MAEFTTADALKTLELKEGSEDKEIRDAYTRMAVRWHPDRNENSKESVQKYITITKAYKKLMTSNEKSEIWLDVNDCHKLFEQFFHIGDATSDTDSNDSNDSDSDNDDCEDNETDSNSSYKNAFLGSSGHPKQNSADSAEKNAAELIDEEEKNKQKAMKKKEQNKRKKEKQRQRKEASKSGSSSTKTVGKSDEAVQNGVSSDDDDAIDLSSAFASKAAMKFKTEKPSSTKPKNKEARENRKIGESIIKAKLGSKLAAASKYPEAIKCYTEAIQLHDKDHRYYGNRSYCYWLSNELQKALDDANACIALNDEYAKGYYRKGCALASLKQYEEAEKCFERVVLLDSACIEATEELFTVRVKQLLSRGFTKEYAEASVTQYGTFHAAFAALVNGTVKLVPGGFTSSRHDDSGTDESTAAEPTDEKQDWRNPKQIPSLWVGNLNPAVSRDILIHLFSNFGEVVSLNVVPQKFYAFINFKDHRCAGKAMKNLQGFELCGQFIWVKYPDKYYPETVAKKKSDESVGASATITPGRFVKPMPTTGGYAFVQNANCMRTKPMSKLYTAPCMYWLKGYCKNGNACTFKHVPEHRGIEAGKV